MKMIVTKNDDGDFCVVVPLHTLPIVTDYEIQSILYSIVEKYGGTIYDYDYTIEDD